MVDYLVIAVLITRFLSLFLGAAIVVIAYKAYARSKAPSMLFLSLGLGFITLGTFVEGILFQFAGLGLNATHAVESLLNVIGFVLMLYSLRAR